jgi:hypothetical protein
MLAPFAIPQFLFDQWWHSPTIVGCVTAVIAYVAVGIGTAGVAARIFRSLRGPDYRVHKDKTQIDDPEGLLIIALLWPATLVVWFAWTLFVGCGNLLLRCIYFIAGDGHDD